MVPGRLPGPCWAWQRQPWPPITSKVLKRDCTPEHNAVMGSTKSDAHAQSPPSASFHGQFSLLYSLHHRNDGPETRVTVTRGGALPPPPAPPPEKQLAVHCFVIVLLHRLNWGLCHASFALSTARPPSCSR